MQMIRIELKKIPQIFRYGFDLIQILFFLHFQLLFPNKLQTKPGKEKPLI